MLNKYPTKIISFSIADLWQGHFIVSCDLYTKIYFSEFKIKVFFAYVNKFMI